MPAWACSRRVRGVAATILAVALGAGPATAQMSEMVSRTAFRVCADPANDPMSSDDGSGYENRIAELFATELGRPVQYTWFPMATGFVRRTLGEGRCDVVIGFAQGHELVQNTNHYMTSAYVLIARADSPLAEVSELADARLAGTIIGIVAGSPPATHMARLGLIRKAKAYPLFVDRRRYSPPEEMLAELEAGTIDAAILWGPIGGPLVKRNHPGMTVTPLVQETLPPRLFYRITMGVRLGEDQWKRELNSLIRRNQDRIDAILTEAGVPLLNDMGTGVKQVSQ